MQSLNDLLNLCTVPRWTVCRMTRQQSVAEHSFRVAAIAGFISQMLGFDHDHARRCTVYGMIHDASEAYTSDCPAPFKDAIGRELVNGAEDKLLPWLHDAKKWLGGATIHAVVKIADQIEGYTWWHMFGDRRMQHPWITEDGPRACNARTVHETCEKYASVLGVEPGFLSRVADDICNIITGGV